jgi:hypothetical protein
MARYQLPIYCIGDSHVNFFSGQDMIQPKWPEKSIDLIPFFKTFRLGAVLAYNLCKLDTKMKGREKLFSLLKQIPKESTIMLCFGEIDCRAHLLKQAEIQNRKINIITKECVDRYVSVIKEVKNLNYNIIIWNVTPSSPTGFPDSQDYPTYGTCRERNSVTRLFNQFLEEQLINESIQFISIFEKLINKRGITLARFLMDDIHLSQAAMPLAIKEINKMLQLNIPSAGNKIYLIKNIYKYIRHKKFMLKED